MLEVFNASYAHWKWRPNPEGSERNQDIAKKNRQVESRDHIDELILRENYGLFPVFIASAHSHWGWFWQSVFAVGVVLLILALLYIFSFRKVVVEYHPVSSTVEEKWEEQGRRGQVVGLSDGGSDRWSRRNISKGSRPRSSLPQEGARGGEDSKEGERKKPVRRSGGSWVTSLVNDIVRHFHASPYQSRYVEMSLDFRAERKREEGEEEQKDVVKGDIEEEGEEEEEEEEEKDRGDVV